METTMKTIKTRTAISATALADIQQKLAKAFATAQPISANHAQFEIIHDPEAPSLEDYGSVAAALIETMGSQEVCYAGYLAAMAAGVPQNIAYALYLACLAT
jgi:archaellum component FlaG (FlaF/FlaG flagellin family)